MIDHLLRDLQVLRKADLLIGKIWLGVFARRPGLSAFAGLIAVFGLGMASLAAYNALQQPIGVIWSACVVAVADLAIAALVLMVAKQPYGRHDRKAITPPRTRNGLANGIRESRGLLWVICDRAGKAVSDAKRTFGQTRMPQMAHNASVDPFCSKSLQLPRRTYHAQAANVLAHRLRVYWPNLGLPTG